MKPKAYTKEELEAYHKFVEDINNAFAEIHLRQMNVDEPVAEEGDEVKEGEAQPDPQPTFGKRILVDQYIHYDFKYLCENSKQIIPEPLWPDPDKEPLPPPVVHQIVKRPPNRSERAPIALYSIWTPKDVGQIVDEGLLPDLTKDPSRWIIPAKESKKIYVKFFSKNIGSFDQVLQFEIIGSYKPFNLTLNAVCEFPTISSNYRNVFMAQKKSRPAQAPESYLQKTFVVSENVFDFGPLLIGKDPEKRHTDETVKKVNSSVF